VDKLISTELLIDKKQNLKRRVLPEEDLVDIDLNVHLENHWNVSLRRMECQSLAQEEQHKCWSLGDMKRYYCTPCSRAIQLVGLIFAAGFYSLFSKVRSIRSWLPVVVKSADTWQGYINTQNNRFWISHNPHLVYEVLLHPVKVGVWCAYVQEELLELSFLTVRLNAKDMHRSFSSSSCQSYQEEKDCGWFQQDSATDHTAPSPDLFFFCCSFWHCLKDKLYNGNPRTEEGKKVR
jgi:hypothetical protein